MGQWKSLKIDSGTGWKSIYREAGSGWKALEWDYLHYDGFESGFSGWSGDTASFAQSSTYKYLGSYSLKKTAGDSHANGHIWKSISNYTNVENNCRIRNSDALNSRGGPTFGITDGNYLCGYIAPQYSQLYILEFNNTGLYLGERAKADNMGDISSTQWVRVKFAKAGNTYTVTAYLENGTQIATCNYNEAITVGRTGYHMFDTNTYMDEYKCEET
jgi:hypothetical protein